MRYTVQPKLLTATSAVALGLVVLIEVWAAILGREPKQFDVEDLSFHFTVCAITTGTTHTVVSGNRLLGWVNRELIRSRIHPISRDHMCTIVTTAGETLLAIGYRHDGDVLRLVTNGYSYPITLNLLDAAVVEPRGRTVPLKDFNRGCYSPTTKEYVHWWVLPRTMTNFVGCGVRLSRIDNGKYVATCRSP